MANDINEVTVLDKDGKSTVVNVDALPDDNPLAMEIDQLNSAIGIHVNGKVIKKEL